MPTKLKTLLHGTGSWNGRGEWWDGDVITVFEGTSVTDSATLSGVNAARATGTVTYTVYAREQVKSGRSWCWQWVQVANAGTVTVIGGKVPNSNPVALPTGTYEWQAAYSGDSANQPSSSCFGSETRSSSPCPPAATVGTGAGTPGAGTSSPCSVRRMTGIAR